MSTSATYLQTFKRQVFIYLLAVNKQLRMQGNQKPLCVGVKEQYSHETKVGKACPFVPFQ